MNINLLSPSFPGFKSIRKMRHSVQVYVKLSDLVVVTLSSIAYFNYIKVDFKKKNTVSNEFKSNLAKFVFLFSRCLPRFS